MRKIAIIFCAALLWVSQGQLRAQEPAVDERQAKAMVFLTKIRFADPDYATVLIACLKGNDLNLLLSSRFPPSQIPVLVKGLAGQLSKNFPGENLRVIAFRPIVPLREAGIASVDGGTGTVTYSDIQQSNP